MIFFVDAAIVRVISSSTQNPYTFAQNNEPTTVIIVNSCLPTPSYYPFPTAEEVADEAWYKRGYVKIGAFGPFNWGQSGNYNVSGAPYGFWPEYYSAIEQQFINQYNSSSKLFKGFSRVWNVNSKVVLDYINAGLADATEPYYVVPAVYDFRGRSLEFDLSCITMASTSYFYTKKSPANPVLSDGAYAGIVIGSVALIAGTIFLVWLIYKEKRGEPLFMPLKNIDDDDDNSNQSHENSGKSIEIVPAQPVGSVAL